MESARSKDSGSCLYKIFFLKIKPLTLNISTLNIELVCQLFIKFNNLGQFWNLLVTACHMRIPKLSLIVVFDEELTEKLNVQCRHY